MAGLAPTWVCFGRKGRVSGPEVFLVTNPDLIIKLSFLKEFPAIPLVPSCPNLLRNDAFVPAQHYCRKTDKKTTKEIRSQ